MNSVHLKSERDFQVLVDGDEQKTCKYQAIVQGDFVARGPKL
jgi:hypothetical protein